MVFSATQKGQITTTTQTFPQVGEEYFTVRVKNPTAPKGPKMMGKGGFRRKKHMATFGIYVRFVSGRYPDLV